MSFNIDSIILAPVFSVFSEAVVYTPAGGTAFTLASGGVFDEGHKEVTFDTGVPLSTAHPVVGVRIADFTINPLQGDTCLIRGSTWSVSDVQADSHGYAKLVLAQIAGVN